MVQGLIFYQNLWLVFLEKSKFISIVFQIKLKTDFEIYAFSF